MLLSELDLYWNNRPSREERIQKQIKRHALFLVICKTSAWKYCIYSRDLLDDALK